MIELRDYQTASVDAMLTYWANGGEHGLIVLPTGCHAPGTNVVMYGGSLRAVEDVRVGELLTGPDSKPRMVLRKISGFGDLYRISPKTGGEPFVVNADHILHLVETSHKANPKYPSQCGGKVNHISVKDYLAKSKWFKHVNKLCRARVDFPDQESDFHVPPYILGAFIGDGCQLHGATITTPDHEIDEAVSAWGVSLGLRTRRSQKPKSKAWDVHLVGSRGKRNPAVSAMRAAGIWGHRAGDKEIPHEYLVASREDRMELLAGLIDTDGHYNKHGFEYSSKSRKLIRQISFLARSLGIAVSAPGEKVIRGASYYRVCMCGHLDETPTRTERRKANPRRQKKNHMLTGFDIEYMGEGPYFGFSLSGDNLYVTEDFIVHHNSGKSLVAAELMRRLYQEYGARVLLATHVSELVTQNAEALRKLWPDAPFGIYHSGLGKRDGDAPLCFAGIHSIYKKPEVVGDRHVLLIDEAHLLSHKDAGMYRSLISHLEERVPGMRVGGLTATPWRTSSGRLDEDHGDHKALFSGIVYEEPIIRMIERGYLAPVIPYVSPSKIDMDGVRTSAGDYNQKDLQAAVDKTDINKRIVDEVILAGSSRSMWLVFASGVEHAHHLTALFRDRGLRAECVTGETAEAERKRFFADARNGTIQVLVGMNVMTTGLDIPNVDLIACVRPTKSLGLWVQMIGRGTRIHESKDNCLLLDFTDNCLKHGPIDQIDGSKAAPGAKGDAPMRECPICHYVHHISIKSCPGCSEVYPEADLKYISQSRAAAVLSTDVVPAWFNVDQVSYSEHRKREWVAGRMVDTDDPPSLKITYLCGLITVSHWVPLESERGRAMAERWWRHNSVSGEPPASVAEALKNTDDLRIPGRLQVTRDGKYSRVTSWDYSVQAIMPAVERAI